MKLEFIPVGRIVNAHGIRGEVRVLPLQQTPGLLTRLNTFYVDGQPLVPAANHAHKGFILLKLPGVDDRDAALARKGQILSARRADLPSDEYFEQELLGMEVFLAGTGERLGEITLVESYPASQVYTVRGERTYLIPAVPGVFIESVDLEANRMEVHILEGMAEDEN